MTSSGGPIVPPPPLPREPRIPTSSPTSGQDGQQWWSLSLYGRSWAVGGRIRRVFSPLLSIQLLTAMLLFPTQPAETANVDYSMQSLCKNHFLQQLYRKIDGAVLTSRNERNLNCVITFQTDSILQRFMLRFDQLSLDCNDHLYIYDGAHPVGSHKADLSCRNTKSAVGALYTRTNFVTLKYVTDGWGTDLNGFVLVVTAVKDQKHECKEFRCKTREFCIATDLICDGINHCGDESDESPQCSSNEMVTLLGMSLTLFVVTMVSVVLIIASFLVGLSICFCRRPPLQHHHHNTNLPLAELTSTGANGAGARKPPENWLHPVGLGYSGLARARLYCQAK